MFATHRYRLLLNILGSVAEHALNVRIKCQLKVVKYKNSTTVMNTYALKLVRVIDVFSLYIESGLQSLFLRKILI